MVLLWDLVFQEQWVRLPPPAVFISHLTPMMDALGFTYQVQYRADRQMLLEYENAARKGGVFVLRSNS